MVLYGWRRRFIGRGGCGGATAGPGREEPCLPCYRVRKSLKDFKQKSDGV